MKHYPSIPPCTTVHILCLYQHTFNVLFSYAHIFLRSFFQKHSLLYYMGSSLRTVHCTYPAVHSMFCLLSPAILYIIFTCHYYYSRLRFFLLSLIFSKNTLFFTTVYVVFVAHCTLYISTIHSLLCLLTPSKLHSNVYTLD